MSAGVVVLIWALCGVVGHIRQVNEMSASFGRSIWRAVDAYVMFIPAMIGGSIILLFFERLDRKL